MQKTAEVLGYPADARLLIINIDDYGFCYTANESAIHTLKNGVASSLTIMMPCPWSMHGVKLIMDNPDISFGVHLTVISEHDLFRWGPMSPRETVPSLVDGGGYFPSEDERDNLIRRADNLELETEFRRQIEAVLAAGLSPTHLDSHCNIHDSRIDILSMTVSLAQEYGLALRIHNAAHIDTLKKAGHVVVDHPDVDSFRLPTEGKSLIYAQMLRELPEGLSEWAIHPARESDELKAITPEWPVRAADFDFFNSEQVRRIIAEEGIEIIRYDLVQKFWKRS